MIASIRRLVWAGDVVARLLLRHRLIIALRCGLIIPLRWRIVALRTRSVVLLWPCLIITRGRRVIALRPGLVSRLGFRAAGSLRLDRKSTRLNSSHLVISYA